MGFTPRRSARRPTELASGEEGKTSNPRRSQFIKFLAISAVLLVLTAACSQGDRSTFNPAGPVAELQLLLFNVLLWVMVVVFVVVEGVLVYAAIHFRARRPLFAGATLTLEGAPDDEGAQLWALDPDGAVAMSATVTFA